MDFKRFTMMIAVFVILAAITIAQVALAWGYWDGSWDKSIPPSPYTGQMSWWGENSSTVWSGATWMRWSPSDLSALKSDSQPRLDLTADTDARPPKCDQLHAYTWWSNIPYFGWYRWNDGCGDPMEEAELWIDPWSPYMRAWDPYHYEVQWVKVASGSVTGEINFSYQREWWKRPDHDWLAKVRYGYYGGASAQSVKAWPSVKLSAALGEVSSTGFYTYTVVNEDGQVRVSISVRFDDPEIRAQYIQAAREHSEALTRWLKKSVPVTLTFAHPLSQEELEAIVESSGLKVDSLILIGIDSYGRRIAAGAVVDKGIRTAVERLIKLAQEKKFALRGAMVLVGEIETGLKDLKTLLDDPRVLLVDATGASIALEIAQKLGIDCSDIGVFTPSPYWYMEW